MSTQPIAVFFSVFLIVVVLFLIFRFLSVKPLREGLDNAGCTTSVGGCADDFNTKLTTMLNVKSDSLNISTYRESYEKLIINMEKWYDLTSLELMCSIQSIDDNSDAVVAKINKYQEFKRNLNDIMKFVDTS